MSFSSGAAFVSCVAALLSAPVAEDFSSFDENLAAACLQARLYVLFKAHGNSQSFFLAYFPVDLETVCFPRFGDERPLFV